MFNDSEALRATSLSKPRSSISSPPTEIASSDISIGGLGGSACSSLRVSQESLPPVEFGLSENKTGNKEFASVSAKHAIASRSSTDSEKSERAHVAHSPRVVEERMGWLSPIQDPTATVRSHNSAMERKKSGFPCFFPPPIVQSEPLTELFRQLPRVNRKI